MVKSWFLAQFSVDHLSHPVTWTLRVIVYCISVLGDYPFHNSLSVSLSLTLSLTLSLFLSLSLSLLLSLSYSLSPSLSLSLSFSLSVYICIYIYNQHLLFFWVLSIFALIYGLVLMTLFFFAAIRCDSVWNIHTFVFLPISVSSFYYYYYYSWVFHISFSGWFLTEVWEIASLLGSPELF